MIENFILDANNMTYYLMQHDVATVLEINMSGLLSVFSD